MNNLIENHFAWILRRKSRSTDSERLLQILLAHEPHDVQNALQSYHLHYGEIALIWSVEDVLKVRSDLTRGEALEVLKAVGRDHDASAGVSWETIDYWAYELYPLPENEHHDDANPWEA